MKNFLFCVGFMVIFFTAQAQRANTSFNNSVDIAGTLGSSQGSVAASFEHRWFLGNKRKWEAGIGVRWTSYVGSNTEFITAPARLARTATTPFLIFFSGQNVAGQDTLTVHQPVTHSANITLNAGYHFSKRWGAGFNIDLIGFTFGNKSEAILLSNGGEQAEPKAKPAAFNLLLTGDHDRGSLNSEFFARYSINNAWGLRAVYQFLFVEYVTTTVEQVAPDGTHVDRFRNKVNAFGLAVSYRF